MSQKSNIAKEVIRKTRISHNMHEFLSSIIELKRNGNCMINAYLYHIGQLTDDNAIIERKKLIQFMTDNKTIADYLPNYTYLDEIHLKALHEMNKINILVFEYHVSTDEWSQNYYFQKAFKNKQCLFLVYNRHNKHYNYCSINNANQFEPSHNIRLHRLIRVMNNYNMHRHDQQSKDVLNNLNDFLYLFNNYNSAEQVESIRNAFGCCNIANCKMFKRNYRNRNRNMNNMYRSMETKDIVRQQLLDKIHCYYSHTFDTNNSAVNAQKHQKYNQLFAESNAASKYKMYSFGYEFYYGSIKDTPSSDAITVLCKYASLQQELLSNDISAMGKLQFDSEYLKASLHWNSEYCKKKLPSIQIEHILALMIYCNFDDLQCNLSKTYRENMAKHTSFFWMGKYLKEAVHQFGTRANRGFVDTFYHGIGEQLVFPSYIHDVCIKCPVSTSTSFEVAINFAMENAKGLVIQFDGSHCFDKYFPAHWLSDYANESECLFIQNQYSLQIANITDTELFGDYDMILCALRVIDKIFSNRHISDCGMKLLRETNLIPALIANQLSKSLPSYKRLSSLSLYAQKMVDVAFKNKTIVHLDGDRCKYVTAFIDSERINIKYLNILFPNISLISVQHISLSPTLIENMLQHLKGIQLGHKSKLKCIELCDMTAAATMAASKYDAAFQALQFRIMQRDKSLYIEQQQNNTARPLSMAMHNFSLDSDPIYYDLYKYFKGNKIISKLILAAYEWSMEPNIGEAIPLTHIITYLLDHNLNEYYFRPNNQSHFTYLLTNTCGLRQETANFIWNYMHSTKCTLPSFQPFEQRLTACNGDCGSKFSQLIDLCAHQKNIGSVRHWKQTIEDEMWCSELPSRALLIEAMKHKQIIRQNAFYSQIYNKLSNENVFVKGIKWSHQIIALLSMLSLDNHMDILANLANSCCEMANNSFLKEINKYHLQKINKLRSELQIISSMIEDEAYQDIKYGLLKHKRKLKQQIANIAPMRVHKRYYKHRIGQIRHSKQYIAMKKKNIQLSNLEILSIILYCDNDIFANQLRASHRNINVNSCAWKKLFTFLHSAIDKIFRALHFQNDAFYVTYVQRKTAENSNLYHGCHGVSLNKHCIQQLPLWTISSFSEYAEVAKSFVMDKGMVLTVNNAYKSIYEGSLKAANVSWISMHCEKEWIVLPTNIKSVNRAINISDCVEKYNSKIMIDSCNIETCKSLQKITHLLYWYDSDRADHAILRYIKDEIDGYEDVVNDCWHCQIEHYQGINRNLLQLRYLDDFFRLSDIVWHEKKCMEYINHYSVSCQAMQIAQCFTDILGDNIGNKIAKLFEYKLTVQQFEDEDAIKDDFVDIKRSVVWSYVRSNIVPEWNLLNKQIQTEIETKIQEIALQTFKT